VANLSATAVTLSYGTWIQLILVWLTLPALIIVRAVSVFSDVLIGKEDVNML
jgi:hypothetical protein